MENMGIQQLGFFLDSEIYVIPEELHLLVDLGKDSTLSSENPLISMVSEPGLEETEEQEFSLEFEGGFEKGVLIGFEGNELYEVHKDLLFKILGAVGCSLKDIALTNSIHIESVSMDSILALGPSKIILFGLFHHDIMSKKINNYEIRQEDGVEYLFADDLGQISENVALKKSLWTALQILFNITKK
ncbi:hypothetical protein [Shivajiella indica]|uniref:Uncharacterized protein n=1 Tax=Shivajiella indica TaxID=872115 RepID=A0ABW5B3H4_9BACT